MIKLKLEKGGEREIIEWQMNISVRARVEDVEGSEQKEAIEADTRLNYLLNRLSEYYVNHGLATDYFEKEGKIDLGKIGTARYQLIPVVKESN